jgi:sporulation protein YlmC with PRC-barrel domain
MTERMNWMFFIMCFLGFAAFPVSAATEAASEQQPASQLGKADKASELIGIDIRDPQQERLGELKELMLDIKSGQIVYVVLGTGGVLGVGDKLVAVPAKVLRSDQEADCLILNADKAALKQAQDIEGNNWPTAASKEFDSFTGYASKPGDRIEEAAGAEPGVEAVIKETEIGATMNFIKASDLIGMSVNNEEKQTLGELSDVAVDLPAGKIRYAVLSNGGFLGVGEKLYAVPMDGFKWGGQRQNLVLNASKDTFNVAKSFDRSQWPTEPDVAFSKPVLQFQKEIVEPAGARRGDASFRSPGSTAQSSDELSATDQSNATEDLAVTQSLRKALVGDDTFSLAAKNVTIVTTETEVALKGMVESVEEAQRIYQKARELAGKRRVTDRLSVKNK